MSINIDDGISRSAALTFYVEHEGARHRAAVYKLAGADYYAWPWLENMGGPTFYVDLVDGRSGAFRTIRDAHFASHASGEIHRRLIGGDFASSKPVSQKISCVHRQPPPSVSTWVAINQITIPLGPLPHAMQDPLRGQSYRRSIVLRKDGFDNVSGVNLVSYWCRMHSLRTLRRHQPQLRSWTLGRDDLLIVIFAEPLRALGHAEAR